MPSENFVWKVGVWRCELEDTPMGPLCSCWAQVSPVAMGAWSIFSTSPRTHVDKIPPSPLEGKFTPLMLKKVAAKKKITMGEVIVIAMPWRPAVPTEVIFKEAERRIKAFEASARQFGVAFTEVET